MLKIFFASHGKMASGMKGSLDILLGNSDNVTVFDAFIDEHIVQDAMDDFFATINDQDTVVLCSDLYGGSVNQAMFLYLETYNAYLIAGINLAFLLELSIKESISKEELLQMVKDSRQAIRFIEVAEIDSKAGEEFF